VTALSAASAAVQRSDDADDARLLSFVVVVLGSALAVGASIQTVFVLGIFSQSYRSTGSEPLLDLAWRVLVNFLAVGATMLGAWLVRLTRRPLLAWIPLGLGLAALGGATRAALQWWSGIHTQLGAWLADAAACGLMILIVLAFAAAAVLSQRRTRVAERRRAQQTAVAAQALASLQSEELRVRRQIAEGLHSRVQGRFVLLDVELNAIAQEVPESTRARLDKVRAVVDDLRENEVRSLSAALYPELLEYGAVPALRTLVARIPSTVRVDVVVDDEAQRLEGRPPGALTETARLLVVRAAEEAVANALRHGAATSLAISLRRVDAGLELRVDDDGAGIPPTAVRSGLSRLEDRLADIGGSLAVDALPQRGTSFVARVPLRAA
jgi:signal transduction histidine kinase